MFVLLDCLNKNFLYINQWGLLTQKIHKSEHFSYEQTYWRSIVNAGVLLHETNEQVEKTSVVELTKSAVDLTKIKIV